MVVLAVSLVLSLGAGAAFGFWGYFAGPAALLLIVIVGMSAALIHEARKKKKP